MAVRRALVRRRAGAGPRRHPGSRGRCRHVAGTVEWVGGSSGPVPLPHDRLRCPPGKHVGGAGVDWIPADPPH